jgi:hypothetical protein
MPARATGPAPAGCLWPEEVAPKLGVKISTLRKWRFAGRGPASFKVEGRVVYREMTVDAYLADCEAADPSSNPALSPLARAPRPHLRRSTAA